MKIFYCIFFILFFIIFFRVPHVACDVFPFFPFPFGVLRNEDEKRMEDLE